MKKILAKTLFLASMAALLQTTKPAYAQPEFNAAAKLMTHTQITDSRAQKLNAYLEYQNSPLVGFADHFVSEADRNHLDWKLVAAIAGTESTFGKRIPTNSYNAWGWGVFTGTLSGVNFKDWDEGITHVSEGLAKNYYGRGAKSIYDVGWRYAANGISWGNHVSFFMNQIDQFVPSRPAHLDITI